MADWQVQEAKAELSALLSAAQDAPQIITRHGQPFAVVLSYAQYDSLRKRESRQPLFSFLRSWPSFEVPLRDKTDHGRDVDL
ncbi:MAG TPA: type II toxin-antitoxin system Phd/YefM family antitoxin [Candidatus Rubrimentiphilum sp.]|jgi:prevent-host-death family protein|nr:type II toxin-antitoxin system Phd/YefM family antitoxin [Candidatus Rubrimentiphilum sp.]